MTFEENSMEHKFDLLHLVRSCWATLSSTPSRDVQHTPGILAETPEPDLLKPDLPLKRTGLYLVSLLDIIAMAKAQGLTPQEAAVYGPKIQGIVTGVLQHHTLIKTPDGIGVYHDNRGLSRALTVGERVKLDLSNPAPTTTSVVAPPVEKPPPVLAQPATAPEPIVPEMPALAPVSERLRKRRQATAKGWATQFED